ncbi:Adenylate cyclase family protein [Elusimicrobium minutum Pei191]|uniref:Adenylate cyclase family protein n=1 Tax=Elusimicrobium minutum (strain Pei191) TaxID=445932 RepID=B2KED9_ELUMP|nr:CYTH domain-containing protein [Elusimicrobium minutum]ACC98885.1 Adenylate cyclase family protein [Elusimicrobium minutum Pei191]
MQKEREFKWAAKSPDDFKVFLSVFKEFYTPPKPVVLKITDNYFDSEDKYFSKNKISCRIRKQQNKYIFTLKGMSKIVNGFAVREEKNINLKQTNLRAAISFCTKKLKTKKLIKKFSISNKRTVYKIKKDFIFEICMDNFLIKKGSKKLRMYEIEMELLKGNEKKFCKLAQNLTKKSKLKFAKISKVSAALKM